MEIETDKTEKPLTPSYWRGLLLSLRPREWVKNLLVFSGLIFSQSLTSNTKFLTSLLGFGVFCLISSGIYIFNDLCDIEADKTHPVKSKRPLPSGLINKNTARLLMLFLFTVGIIGAFSVNSAFALILAVYLTINFFYSLHLKNVVILDVICISSGFVIRAIAGALALKVEVSTWLVLCTSMVALLVGFGKRRHEITILGEEAGSHRKSLSNYSTSFLDSMMNICAGLAIATYALYSMSEETVSRFGTHNLLLTLPFVLYGVFRYLFLIHKREEGGDPVQLLFRDRPSLINIILWIITVCLVIYLPSVGGYLLGFSKY